MLLCVQCFNHIGWDPALSTGHLNSIAEGRWAGLWIDDRDPRRYMITEQNSEKLSLHLSQYSVLLYALLCLSVMSEAILL